MKETFTVITNNSMVADYIEKNKIPIELKWVATAAIEVLTTAKSAVHTGAVLISNPEYGIKKQSGSIFGSTNKVPQNGLVENRVVSISPYLTIILSPSVETLDFNSVKIISNTIALYKKNARQRFLAHNDEAIRAFQTYDLEMVVRTFVHINSIATL